MSRWSIQIIGPLTIEREGVIFRPRIRHHSLLLVRLCAFHPKRIYRSQTASLLWPEASREHALAYLRRAVMELKRAGLSIVSDQETLSLDTASVHCDLLALRNAKAASHHRVALRNVLLGIEHPIASEAREIVEAVVHRSLTQKGNHSISEGESEEELKLLSMLGKSIVKSRPNLAFQFLADNRELLADASHHDSVLDLIQRLLSNPVTETTSTVVVRIMASRIARFKTKYSLAEQLLEDALPLCFLPERSNLLVECYSEFSLLRMDQRRWPEARELADKGLEVAIKVGDHALSATALFTVGGCKWQTDDYRGGIEDYLEAYRISMSPHQKNHIQANLAYLYGILEMDFEMPTPDLEVDSPGAYETGANSYRLFALHFRKSEYAEAAKNIAIQLEITANNDMERLFCVSLDCASIAFYGLGRSTEAAVCVRLGTRLRRQVGHSRSPMEIDSLRKHLVGSFFGKEIQTLEMSIRSDDLVNIAARLSHLLRQ